MEHASLWQKTVPPLSEYSQLKSDLTCDAVVIGAGLTGVLTAHMLKKQGMDVILLDAGTPGQGTTAHTTAKITAQHGLCFAKMISSYGFETAKRIVQANLAAVESYSELIHRLQIDCEFQRCDCYLYDCNTSAAIRSEWDAARALGMPVTLTRETQLPFSVAAAMKLPGQALFHPLKFLNALLDGLTIYGNTSVTALRDGCAETKFALVRAKHFFITTRFPFFLLPGLYFARMHQERSYAISVSGAAPLNDMYLDTDKSGTMLRPWRDQLILSGHGHRTGLKPTQNGYDALSLAANRWYPGCRITAQWSAEDCVPADGIPYIGRYDQGICKLYVATGFREWGMTSAMTAARILTDLVLGRKNRFASVFSPHRLPNSKGLGQILADGGISSANLLRQAFWVPRSVLDHIHPGEGGVVQWNGRKTGVFHREDGKYFFVSTRCPHMGCQLSWNQIDRSWDCPCHGSRFSYDGTCLDPPAAGDISCQCHKK